MVSATLLRRVKFFPLLLVLSQMLGCNSEEFDVRKFLESYDYIKPSSNISSSYSTRNPVKEGIKLYQQYYGLEETGILDTDTLSKMKAQRCGVKDRVASGYKVFQNKWYKTNLTYVVLNGNLPPTITYHGARQEIKKAFKAWNAVTNLEFFEIPYLQADIVIRFGGTSHDYCPHLFREQDLAHAGEPPYGYIHINNRYLWTAGNKYYGKRLLATVAHEIGHTLGLDHSNNVNALMYSYETTDARNPILHDDDIKGIQYLYGRKINYPWWNYYWH